MDFISVAENIATGAGFTRSIKAYYFDDLPVMASGSLVKPMLTPYVFSLILRVRNNYYSLQFFNLFLESVDVILFYLLARYFMDEKLSFVTSSLIALNPNLIIENRFIESEPLFYFFLLTFFITYFHLSNTFLKYMLLGTLAGLAYLTRIEGVLLLVCIIVLKIKKPLLIIFTVLFFIIVCLPSLVINYYVSGNPFHSYYLYHFSIFTNAAWTTDFYKPMPTPVDFIKNNFKSIVSIILNIQKEFIIFITGFRFLGLLSILLIIYNYKKNFKYVKPLFPIILFLILYYIIQTFSWATYCCQQRHFAFIYTLLVLIIGSLWTKVRLKVILYFLIILTVLIYILFDIRQTQWIRASIGTLESRRGDKVFTWIRSNTKHNDIVATRSPYDMYLWTSRPTILIPSSIPHVLKNIKEFKSFEKKYNVKYVYVETPTDLHQFLTQSSTLMVESKNGGRLYCVSECK